MKLDIRIIAQTALLGEVPSTLRFVYVQENESSACIHAVFDKSATEEEIECASRFCTEINASYPIEFPVEEKIEINESLPWKKENGEGLVFLRYGEMEGF